MLAGTQFHPKRLSIMDLMVALSINLINSCYVRGRKQAWFGNCLKMASACWSEDGDYIHLGLKATTENYFKSFSYLHVQLHSLTL